MTIRPANAVPKAPPSDAVFTCITCLTPWIPTSWKDMQRATENKDKTEIIVIFCPNCENSPAKPAPEKMSELVSLHTQWLQLQPTMPLWTDTVKCPECREWSKVTAQDMTWFNEPDGSETWAPKVYMHCPYCFSDTPVDNFSQIPSGVRQYVLDVAELER